jgi:xylan 1,4-beta-xylosidase
MGVNAGRLALLTIVAAAVSHAATVPPGTQAPTHSNPVIPGDHPDPSLVRTGDEYWATATTSQWAPIFPLLRSRDLVNWTLEGAVFQEPPGWSGGSYWAPEIAEHAGTFFVYYTARRKNGPLCVAVATAPKPLGPWTDRGPLVCQDVGSIDAVAVTGHDGRRYLIWKEDGNSRKLPTPLWAQQLTDDGAALTGRRTEILRNEAAWEGHLIEGPFVVDRDGWFYLFYSAGACCGRKCDYRLGVARAREIRGPWERNPANPILQANEHWKCPGHGSLVTTPEGRTFLLYHAYHPKDFEYSGRQGLLDEVIWQNGWPTINGGRGPSAQQGGAARTAPVADGFESARLDPRWQWPWDRTPKRSLRDGTLRMFSSGRDPSDPADTIVGQPAMTGDYTATVWLERPSRPDAFAGLSVYGNAANAIGLSLSGERVILWRREKGAQQILASVPAPETNLVALRVTASGGSRFAFAIAGQRRAWQSVSPAASAGHLPPWDLAVRIALAVGGPAGSEGRFDRIQIEYGS